MGKAGKETRCCTRSGDGLQDCPAVEKFHVVSFLRMV